MAEEKDNSASTIGLIILGAAVFYLILKSNSQTKQVQQQMQQQVQQQVQQQMQQVQQKIASNSINSIYENDEKWQIERGDNGHIIDLRVVRNARVSDGTYNPSGLPSLHVPDTERVAKPVELQQDRIAEMAKIARINESYRMNESYRREHFGMV